MLTEDLTNLQVYVAEYTNPCHLCNVQRQHTRRNLKRETRLYRAGPRKTNSL